MTRLRLFLSRLLYGPPHRSTRAQLCRYPLSHVRVRP